MPWPQPVLKAKGGSNSGSMKLNHDERVQESTVHAETRMTPPWCNLPTCFLTRAVVEVAAYDTESRFVQLQQHRMSVVGGNWQETRTKI
jgi:hypothetical protein